jgi:hypothetical protein
MFMSHELAAISGLVARLHPVHEILAAYPERLNREHVMAEAERQLAGIEGNLLELEGYRDEPLGFTGRVTRLAEKRAGFLGYLGRRPERAELQVHRADAVLRTHCLTSPAGHLARIVERVDQRRQEHTKRLDSLNPLGIGYPAVKVFLTSTVARYGAALARSAEVHSAIAHTVDELSEPLRRHWLAGHPDANRYVTLCQEAAGLVFRDEFTGADGAEARSIGDRARNIMANARQEVEARVNHVRTRASQGEPDGLTIVLTTVEDNPARFPVGAARQLRLAVYHAAAAVDALVFANLTTEWPEAAPAPTPAAPVNAWSQEGPSPTPRKTGGRL